MKNGLYSLVYLSQATRPMTDDDLADILRVSRANNSQRAITGLLLHESDVFMQALEGPRAAVEALFARISRDDRHRDVVVLVEDEISARNFGAWRMAYHRVQPGASGQPDGFSTLLETYRHGGELHVDSRLVFPMLVMFIERLPVVPVEI